jgi:hypothetical protein
MGTCTWTLYLGDKPPFNWRITVLFVSGRSQVFAAATSSPYWDIFSSDKEGFHLSGENEAMAYWRGGSCQCSFGTSAHSSSLSSLADNLGISRQQKTFCELYGQDPANNQATQRLARQFDGTNVYVKRFV